MLPVVMDEDFVGPNALKWKTGTLGGTFSNAKWLDFVGIDVEHMVRGKVCFLPPTILFAHRIISLDSSLYNR